VSESPASDSYPGLERFEVSVPAGTEIYGQGEVPDRFYVLLDGVVVFRVVNALGAPSVVRRAHTGEMLGHVAAFSGRPTSASATTFGECRMLAVPVREAEQVFARAPALAMTLARELSGAVGTRGHHDDPDADDVGTDLDEIEAADEPIGDPEQPAAEAAASDELAKMEELPVPASERASPMRRGQRAAVELRVDEPFEEDSYFVDDVVCPLCLAHFEYLRVRTGAVRPLARESDFYVRYRGLDSTLYAIVVCPRCAYTAYGEEFPDLDESERRPLLAERERRGGRPVPQLTGVRDLADAATALDLALEWYELRGGDARRRAGLLHRRAWVERSRGDAAAELRLLREARDAYRVAFERDSAMSEAAVVRASYLVADLTMRLGDLAEAARWFQSTLELPEAQNQRGLLRLARTGLQSARERLQSTSGGTGGRASA
jgi:uncharacterized protein (DUF2225 family)